MRRVTNLQGYMSFTNTCLSPMATRKAQIARGLWIFLSAAFIYFIQSHHSRKRSHGIVIFIVLFIFIWNREIVHLSFWSTHECAISFLSSVWESNASAQFGRSFFNVRFLCKRTLTQITQLLQGKLDFLLNIRQTIYFFKHSTSHFHIFVSTSS